ncbi:MAG: UDP-N-acetylmuramate dehydrogenase [Candidatus Nomurabacteria bacterium]
MIKIEEYVDIKDYSTLKIGGQFRYFTVISKVDELPLLYAIAQSDGKYKNTPTFVLGGGSNIVFSDGILNVLALKIEIMGHEIVGESNEYVDIKVGAGENWDNFVRKTVDMNLVGIEALSLIPGTVGASPVQNIGAYGSEVKDTIHEVEVFDIEKREFSKISNKDCKFGYRDSIFKNEVKGRYIITGVTYRLNKSLPSIPKYPGVAKYFEDMEIVSPTLSQIRDAIIYIRKEKLPDSSMNPNVGSFFKNPIVLNAVADTIKIDFPDAKFFQSDDYHTKVPAGWLIENAGLKGKSFGKVSVYDKSALVLINDGNATCEDIIKARNEIIKIVKDKFGIELEQEPEII